MMSENTTMADLTGMEVKNSERGMSYGVIADYNASRDAVKVRDVSGTERWQSAENIRIVLKRDAVEAVEADF